MFIYDAHHVFAEMSKRICHLNNSAVVCYNLFATSMYESQIRIILYIVFMMKQAISFFVAQIDHDSCGC